MLKGDYAVVQELIAARSIPEPNSGCWLWDAACDRDGYGRLKHRRTSYIATRAAYEAFHGVSPKGWLVMHGCDNAFCVNPKHLFLGSNAQNIAASVARGRRVGPGGNKVRHFYRGRSAYLKSDHAGGDDLTAASLAKVLAYDPETGEFRWLGRPGDISWTTRFAGKIAGSVAARGKPGSRIFYRQIRIGSRDYLAHRLAWLYMHGTMPEGTEIDHRDGDGLNNRIDNLRCATHAQNGHNTGLRRNNTSGVKGVSWVPGRGKWVAMITEGGKQRSLGRYDTFEEAIEVRRTAEAAYHGDYARKAN